MLNFRSILSLFAFAGLAISGFSQNKEKADELLKKLSEHPREDTIRATLLADLAKEYRKSDPEKVFLYGNLGLELSKKLDFKKGEALVYTTFGVLMKDQGLPDSALVYHFMALQICKDANLDKMISRVFNNIGVAYKEKMDYNSAVKYYNEAIKINMQENDIGGLASNYNNIGIIYKRQGRYAEALEYYQKAIDAHTKNNDEENMASSMNNMISIFMNLGRVNEALPLMEKVEKIFLKVNNVSGLAIIYSHYSDYHKARKDFKKAEEYSFKSAALLERINDRDGLARNYMELGDLYILEKKYNDAMYYIDRGLTLANEIGAIEIISDGYNFQSVAYEGAGEYKKALESHRKFLQYKDSLVKLRNVEQLNVLQAQFDSDQKGRELELMRQRQDLSDAQNSRNRIVNYALMGGLILVFGFLFMVIRNYMQNKKKNVALAEKNAEIEEKNRDITDSIRYAKRLQEAILPEDEQISDLLGDHFVLYKSKDIVSGDIYWVEKHHNRTYFAAIDCTGHGVPGAFMSIMAFNLLKQSVLESDLVRPSAILDDVNLNLRKMLHKQTGGVHDGMDIALCCYDKANGTLEYAGANNPLWLVRKGEIQEIKGDKLSIGLQSSDSSRFTNHIVKPEKGDTIYIFSDGYADQFGGEKGKKVMNKNFRKILLDIQNLAMPEQKTDLLRKHEQWKGKFEQVDDILILGVRV